MRVLVLAAAIAVFAAGCSGGPGSSSRPEIRTTVEVASVVPRLVTQIEICLYNAGDYGARVDRTLVTLYDANGVKIFEGSVQIPAPNIPGEDPPALWPKATACNSLSVGSDQRDNTHEVELSLSWRAMGQQRVEYKMERVSFPYQR